MDKSGRICTQREILLGYDEGCLSFSAIAAGFCRLVGERPPYWRLVRKLNVFPLKLEFGSPCDQKTSPNVSGTSCAGSVPGLTQTISGIPDNVKYLSHI